MRKSSYCIGPTGVVKKKKKTGKRCSLYLFKIHPIDSDRPIKLNDMFC